jgi:hypothetical protein
MVAFIAIDEAIHRSRTIWRPIPKCVPGFGLVSLPSQVEVCEMGLPVSMHLEKAVLLVRFNLRLSLSHTKLGVARY